MKNIVGIPGRLSINLLPQRPKWTASSTLSAYVDRIREAGAGCITMHVTSDNEEIDSYIDMIDGLLLAGGVDVHPSLYGEEMLAKCSDTHLERDIFEMALYRKAVEKGIPVLGICRGFQLINVACGGSLYQDLSYVENNKVILMHNSASLSTDDLQHLVHVKKGSIFRDIVEVDNFFTNSIHHQTLKKIGEGLKVVGLSSDSCAEVIENSNGSVIATQYHPEVTADIYAQRLFKYFINKMKAKGDKKI